MMPAKILVVDDEERARKNMSRLIRDRGFEVISGSSASEAEMLINKFRFDVVVTDMLMENDQAGLEVLNAAKEKDALTEVIIITAYGSISNAVNSTRLGAFDYIEKDADDINDILCLKVEESIKRRESHEFQFLKPLVAPLLERRKILANVYDTFFVYNADEKQRALLIGDELKKHGLNPWFDENGLLPNWMYVEEVERILHSVKSVTVLIGEGAIPPWDHLKFAGFFQKAKTNHVPIIAAVLSNVQEIPSLPLFMCETTWVDFRSDDSNPLEMLIQAIER